MFVKFDSHVHLDVRCEDDMKTMSLAGIRYVLTLAHDPMPFRTAEALLGHWEAVESIAETAVEYLIDVKVGLGIHPRAIPDEGIELTLERLESKLSDLDAVGEVGLEEATDEEVEVLRKQLDLAATEDVPVIVHTPRSRDPNVISKIIEVASDSDLDHDLIVIDHLNEQYVDAVLAEGFNAGITVQPGKATVEEAVEIVTNRVEHADRILINSDASRAPSNVLAVAEVAFELEKRGFDATEAVVRDNALQLF
ncbi:TatD family hydrolase [Methanopyrus sp. KOL6]|uniref:TatD family hydrolase n=1 Tax=Methanopyrus sp. KOL6 TaxID=1937004 RepID=UPI000B4BB8C0|nr:TatD family hydrolase [Methanopyrus sp. KOL6]